MISADQLSRQTWLDAAVKRAIPLFEGAGYVVPPINISCGFPSTGIRGTRIGECWPTQICSSGINEIFISPVIEDTEEVIGIIFHEIAHAVDDCKSGHGAKFKKIATTVGLTGKMIHAHPNEVLGKTVKLIAAELGGYPHRKLLFNKPAKKRLPRPYAKCEECGYRVPMLKKYLGFGPPICPRDNVHMSPEGNWD